MSAAEEYLNQLKDSQRFFHYLAEIASGPRPPELDERDANDRDVSADIREQVDRLLAWTGSSLSPAAAARLRKVAERGLSNQDTGVDWPRIIHEEFLGRVSDEGRRHLAESGEIAVGALCSADFNGAALEVPGVNGAWVVVLNEGLSVLTYGVARILASTFHMVPNTGGDGAPPTLTREHAAAMGAKIIRYYVHLGLPVQETWQATREHVFLASRVASMAERFVYAHEIAHVLLGHTASGIRRAVPAAYEDLRQLEPHAEQEHEADVVAWQLLVGVLALEKTPDGPVSDLQMAYAGACLFLRIAGLLERLEDLATGSHPPALERLALLRADARHTADQLKYPFEALGAIEAALGSAFDAVMGAAAEPTRSPLDDLLERILAAEKEGRASIEAIMARGEARRELLWLLSKGAPGKLCRALGRALGRAERELLALGFDMRRAPTEGEPPRTPDEFEAAREPFGRFSLISGIVEAYLVPDIRRFIDRHHAEYLKEGGYGGG